MRAFATLAAVVNSLAWAVPAHAQTAYPMLMSLDPVAVQAGTTTECELSSRYSMFGAYKVLVAGEGVTGEIATPMEAADGKSPNLQELKLRFAVASDALPGVRSFRIATPQGASTLGQLVVTRNPVVVEAKDNNTPAGAQPLTLPTTVCGAIERTEDVDYFRFSVEAGSTLNFRVLAMQLQDAIHDLQQHADPIIAVKHASGTTLATADNDFAADPLLNCRFDHAGEYLLEIRDVRYQGNRYWQYAIEISDRPLVTNVHPLAVSPGSEREVELVGLGLPPGAKAPVSLPAEAAAGPVMVPLPFGEAATNPAPLVVSDLPVIDETSESNDTPPAAQTVPVPGGIAGRIAAGSDIDCFAFEAHKDERFSFEVVARRHGSALDPVLRVLSSDGRTLSENDDLRLGKRNYADSWIENWIAPADGRYVLEVRDLHLRGGPAFVYFLTATRAEPYFELVVDTDKTQLTPGTSGVLFVNCVRKNGFEDEIQLAIEGLPAGVTANCGRIPAGQRDGCIILTAAAEASLDAADVIVSGFAPAAEQSEAGGEGTATPSSTATPDADSAGAESPRHLRTAIATPYQETYMPGGGRGHWPVETHTVAVGATGDIRGVTLSTHEVTLGPGESQVIDVTIERAAGFTQNVQLDLLYRHLNSVYADTLPPGVTIDARNSKTLLNGTATSGQFTLTAARDAKPFKRRQVAVMANVSINFVMKATTCAAPLLVTVKEAERSN